MNDHQFNRRKYEPVNGVMVFAVYTVIAAVVSGIGAIMIGLYSNG